MSAKKKSTLLFLALALCPLLAIADCQPTQGNSTQTLTQRTLAQQLGWVSSPINQCGGYYLEPAFTYPEKVENQNAIEITGNSGLLAQRGTSILENGITITRQHQQITANRAYLYRDPKTFELTAAELRENVHLREPNTLVVSKEGLYNFKTKAKSLRDILYRTTLNNKRPAGAHVTAAEAEKDRRITQLTAWGQACEFSQTEPGIYELSRGSYSTCPPDNPAWRLKASHIVLDKNTGRGYATHARLLVKNVPVLYLPYINFPIDRQRKSGFLWPTVGGNSKWGAYVLAPFYWNMAPNYDMTLTTGLLYQRGLMLGDNFRYLTETSYGNVDFTILPHDRTFAGFQQNASQNPKYTQSTNTETQAELNRLLNDSTFRKGLVWRNESRFNDYWSSHIDFNYAGDDYYLRDFGSNLNALSQNQLLQEGDLFYKGPHWDFTGRLQAYQTLHPINEPQVTNQYRRFPQLILNGDYPDQALGLEYFIYNEATHFDILNTPGTPANQPVGNRLHTQPGITLPLTWPYFYVNPRAQLALTDYSLYQTADTQTPNTLHRALPILDVPAGFSFSRDTTLFNHDFQQTLEPQLYYVYIPYRDQSAIPIFDTTVNTLTYDQIFNYNRFSGIDRIGDTNQVGLGVTTRFIDTQTGLEKVRLAIGDIIYFSNRRVTFCNDANVCIDNPTNPANSRAVSPISGLLDYHINPAWKFGTDLIFNPITSQMDNANVGLHYQPDELRILNFGFSYAHGSDPFSGIATTSPQNELNNNLKVTDFSFAWPVMEDVSVLGRWSENWNGAHLQNLLYGLQYDTCCWAVRMVGGRAFIGSDPNNNNRPQYNNEFYIQFSLKGLGNIDSGNPSGLLHSITGYNSQFG